MNTQQQEVILVTGGCGYIGSHICQKLQQKRQQVVVIDNLSTGNANSLLGNEKLYIGDVSDYDLLSKIMKEHHVTQVCHLAASSNTCESVSYPLQYYYNNNLATTTLLKAMVTCNIKKIIYSSSAAIYGSHDNNEDLKEHSHLSPSSPYGWSKFIDERIISDTTKAHNLNSTILRYFNVAGADLQARIGQRGLTSTHLIKIIAEYACNIRNTINIYGNDYETFDGTAIRDYLHVEDLADIHIKFILENFDTTASKQPVVYNCGYGKGFSVQQVITASEEVLGNSINTRYLPRRLGDPTVLVACIDKLAHSCSWQPKYNNLHTIIESAIQWEKRLQQLKCN